MESIVMTYCYGRLFLYGFLSETIVEDNEHTFNMSFLILENCSICNLQIYIYIFYCAGQL